MSQIFTDGSLRKSSLFRNACYLVALLTIILLLGCTYYYFVRTTTGRYMDQMAFRQAELTQKTLVMGSADFLNNLPLISLIIAIIISVVSLAKNPNWQQLFRILIIALTMGAANISTRLLKLYIFDRPDVGLENWFRNSLPSGHTTLAASSAAAIFLMVAPRWRPAVGFLGSSYAIVAGISTLLNQWHRPADVIAAFFVVTVWALICSWIITSFTKIFIPQKEKTSGNFPKTSILWIILSLLLGGLPAVMFLKNLSNIPAIIPSDPSELLYTNPDSTNFFWGGVSLIAFTGYAIVIGAILWLICFPPEKQFSPAYRKTNRSTRYL